MGPETLSQTIKPNKSKNKTKEHALRASLQLIRPCPLNVPSLRVSMSLRNMSFGGPSNPTFNKHSEIRTGRVLEPRVYKKLYPGSPWERW